MIKSPIVRTPEERAERWARFISEDDPERTNKAFLYDLDGREYTDKFEREDRLARLPPKERKALKQQFAAERSNEIQNRVLALSNAKKERALARKARTKERQIAKKIDKRIIEFMEEKPNREELKDKYGKTK